MNRFFYVLILGMLNVINVCAATAENLIEIPGYVSLKNKAELLGTVEENKQLVFSVWLKLKNQEGLKSLIDELYNPASSKYQNFLTKKEFDLQFGPNPSSFKSIQNYFSKKGLSVKIMDHYVQVSGLSKQINAALHTQISRYRYQGRIVFAPANKPTIDKNVAQYISTITGLDDIDLFKPMHIKAPQEIDSPKEAKQDTYYHKKNTHLNTVIPMKRSDFTGVNLRKAYNVQSIKPINNTAIDGSGQTIVILVSCSESPEIFQNDANIFNAANGLPLYDSTNFFMIGQNGGEPPPITSPRCSSVWALETAIDVQAAHTLAPAATVVLIIADGPFMNNFSIAENYAVQNFPGALVSHSWGLLEAIAPSHNIDPFEAILQQGAVQGLSFAFATGDSGDAIKSSGSLVPRVAYPSSSPYAIAIGGSSLYADINWNYLFEGGWGIFHSYPPDDLHFESGGGGGVSRQYPALSFQAEAIGGLQAGGYGVVSDNLCDGKICRALPDIAMVSDPKTALIVYNTLRCKGFCAIGGTSLGAPVFIGALALVNHARMLVAGRARPIGLLTPYLYKQYEQLQQQMALHVVNPPHFIVPRTNIAVGYPLAFQDTIRTYNMNSSLTMPENQIWNDVVGVGTPNVPNFISALSTI